MKILLIDQNYSFTTDIESRMILSDDFETEIITLNNVDETQAKLKMFSPDRIVLNADILQYYPDCNLRLTGTGTGASAGCCGILSGTRNSGH